MAEMGGEEPTVACDATVGVWRRECTRRGGDDGRILRRDANEI